MTEPNLDSPQSDHGQPGNGASCAVKLPVFEGPLDLLLHLIRSNEVDIADIPISLISDQYLRYLDLMRMLDIDLAADYLLMAATLAYIKSRMLLPPDPDADDAEEGADPRAELARRLAEYAVFVEAAQELGGRPLLGRDVYRGWPDTSAIPQGEPVLEASLWGLLEAMKRVLESIPDAPLHHEIVRETITVQDCMIRVMDLLGERPGDAVLFEDLFSDAPLTRQRVVLTFLAMLELAKIQAIRIFQNATQQGQPFGPLRVRAAVERDAASDALA